LVAPVPVTVLRCRSPRCHPILPVPPTAGALGARRDRGPRHRPRCAPNLCASAVFTDFTVACEPRGDAHHPPAGGRPARRERRCLVRRKSFTKKPPEREGL